MVIEQAKGVLAAGGGIDVDRAFGALRDYARRDQMRLDQLASKVIVDQPMVDQVLNRHPG